MVVSSRDGSTSVAAAYQSSKRQAYFRTLVGRNGATRVQGMELVGTVQTAFVSLPALQISHSVNPVNSQLFPRLSGIARTFERYSFKHPGGFLKFHYDGECPSSTPGVVLGYFGYDPIGAIKSSVVEILDEKTNLKCASWYPGGRNSCLDVDVGRQFSDYLFAGGSLASGSLTGAEARQQFLGNVNLACMAGPSTTVLAGFFWVEYDVELTVQIAPEAISLAAIGPANQAVSAAATGVWPLQTIQAQAGIEGQASITPTAGYVSAGGKVGLVDAARAAYEAGTYLVDLYGTWTAAASIEEPKGKNEKTEWESVSDFRPRVVAPKGAAGRVPRFQQAEGIVSCKGYFHAVGLEACDELRKMRRSDPNASGDISYNLAVYDVSSGIMDSGFPITASGMSQVGSTQAVTFTGTGAYNPIGIGPVFSPIVVPSGSIYAFQPSVTLGATTARTLVSGLEFGVHRILGETTESAPN